MVRRVSTRETRCLVGYALVFSLLAAPFSVTGQGVERGERAGAPRLPVSVEAFPFYAGTPPSPAVRVHYRIGDEFFVFVRDDARGVFSSDGELLFELLDDRGTTVSRAVKLLNRTRTSPIGDGPASDLEGAVTLSVRPGHYTLLVNIEDRKSGRSFLNRDISLAVEALPPTGLALISLFFAERRLVPDADATPEFVPLNRGADLLFGAPAGSGALVQLAADSSSGTVSVRWELTNTPDLAGLPPVSFTDSAFELYSGIAVPDTTVRYLSYRIAPSEGTFKTLFIPLPFEKLQVGTSEFSISLSSAGGTKKHKGRFRVLWLQQPLSLQDLNLAIDALQHIVGEKEMDALFSVSRNERAKNFARFWRERDRDTTTAYNEVMAEYYRRVDEAIRAYSSANETDGYKTDRGRVFILYGTPTHTRRFLEPGEPPREVWTYQHLQRRFIFTDVRKNGQYRLTGSEPL